MFQSKLNAEDSTLLHKYLQNTERGAASNFSRLVDAALELPRASLGFTKGDYIVFKSPRYNFAECNSQSSGVRIRLRRKADYTDPNGWLTSEPAMPDYRLNQFFVLNSESDVDYAIQLIRTSYEDASGIELEATKPSLKDAFAAYLDETNRAGSGKAGSYVKGIELLGEMLNLEPYGFEDCQDIWSVQSPERLLELRKRVLEEQKKGSTPWTHQSIPPSYLHGGHCSAALSELIDFIPQENYATEVLGAYRNHSGTDKELASKLEKIANKASPFAAHDPDSKDGQDRIVQSKARNGQYAFRKMILENYGNRCCITGLDIPALNRASHIIGWAERRDTRMFPSNGLCLSATYDAAFDKHLISLDEDYRIILSKELKEHYSSESVETYFKSKEGVQITLPSSYLPKNDYLMHHRKKGSF